MNTEWTSVHIFCGSQIDCVLVEKIAPLLRELERSVGLNEAFFLRYWNGGPHIRLRLRCSEPVEAVFAILGQKLHLPPSERGIDPAAEREYLEQVARTEKFNQRFRAAGDDIEDTEPLQALGSIQLRNYRYDFRRYGESARNVVETHFCYSSQLALYILRETLDRPQARCTVALLLLCAAVGAFAIDSRQMAGQLFAVSQRISGQPLSRSMPAGQDEIDGLRMLARLIGEGLPIESQDVTVNAVLAAWQAHIYECRSGLRQLWNEGRLRSDPDWYLLDFCHLLMNRLGFDAEDEGHLYRVTAQAMLYRPDQT